MNRIEKRLQELKIENKKALITYMTAGLPSLQGTKDIILAQDEAGCDVIELGVPFSDPVADGPVIQDASFKAIQLGVNLKKVFTIVENVRKESQIPIVLMLYYNTILYYGVKAFVERCIGVGVDGLIIPDLPFEEQGEINEFLGKEEAPILIQLVSPVSKNRIPKILEHARGFVYCVSSMGVTGQDASFHKNIIDYLKQVKNESRIPVMMGFGIRTAKDVEPMKHIIDGVIVGSYFIQLMEENDYQIDKIKEYCKSFKKQLN
ncbi:tryptophan synthase alpha chain [Lachnotalea glycerini]|uniref:Tryptophan synthase alpha chain n=1 Tax=Lachnotalea glycerini TaxID=1763509 RepID=A0A255I529_9FIRM|nr:tryptophan synthase subunit alpha [Lachnotalea glycerini]PXV93668.1 tryptophan synthase alpha chain [Lachnotalea glycerini]RDY32615.1 tryptophan synthase subunit alpha [Lachnotalea glycerini]